MWTVENRRRYDRGGLRDPSDLTGEEWSLIAPQIPPAKRGGNKRTVDVREVVGGFKRSSQHGLFRLIVGTGPGPRREFSSLASFEVCH